MKRSSILVVGLVFVFAAISLAQQPDSLVPRPFELQPFECQTLAVPAVSGRESRAVATGNGRSAIGLYVFDTYGRCVGFDDEPTTMFDDRVLSWVPTTSGAYSLELRNLGAAINQVEANAK